MSDVRAQLLREMGISTVWRLRARELEAEEGGQTALPRAQDSAPLAADQPLPEQAAARASTSPESQVSPLLASEQASVPASAPASEANADRAGQIARLDWETLESEIRACRACGLCEKRRQAVPGMGDRGARWMFVGEGPGAEEDRQGLPFVGSAGRLLDAMLAAIGLSRGEQVYIANTVKCRPPMNRTPTEEEMGACWPYLARQIELVQPELIVALGRPAAQTLLDTEIRIGASRGKVFHYRDIPVIVTYHPAYLLRNQHDKRKVWEDLLRARELVLAPGRAAIAPEN